MSTETTIRSREDILREISQLEDKIQELRLQLPTSLKSFFRFRVSPGKFSWVYALSRNEAETLVTARMTKDYGVDGWSFTSRVVDQFNDPQIACGESSGNLLQSLTETDATEFVGDWERDKAGKAESEDIKHKPKSRLELDIAQWKTWQRNKA